MSAFFKNATLLFIVGLIGLVGFSQKLETKRLETNVFFGFDQDQLEASAQEIIDLMFPWETNFYPESISLVGFTDKSGSSIYNKELALRRVNAVKNYIYSTHVSNTLFKTTSIGEDQPAFDCSADMNRCVKIVMLLKEKDEPVSLKRCQELFPEEFLLDSLVLQKNVRAKMIPEQKPDEENVVLDDNKFQKKLVDSETEMIRLNDILFYGNSDRYYKSATPELEQLAEFLLANPDYFITITGHVNGDKSSSRQLRKETKFQDVYELSLARADAIKFYLVEQGIAVERITAEGKGGEELLFPKPTTQAESEANRRIEVTFHKTEN